jgi:hypothetical protein
VLAFNWGGGILIGLTWAVFGLLVLVGRTTQASMAEGHTTVGSTTVGSPTHG